MKSFLEYPLDIHGELDLSVLHAKTTWIPISNRAKIPDGPSDYQIGPRSQKHRELFATWIKPSIRLMVPFDFNERRRIVSLSKTEDSVVSTWWQRVHGKKCFLLSTYVENTGEIKRPTNRGPRWSCSVKWTKDFRPFWVLATKPTWTKMASLVLKMNETWS